ncbi:MAG: hypothetical protein HKN32_09170 [Flavobacteriales bacterium]|nr:hypothetical protein [Flavobacteriales bacterium]
MRYWLLVATVLTLAACGHKDSPQIKEALKIHEENLALSKSFQDQLQTEIDATRVAWNESLASEDTLTGVRLENTLKMLEEKKIALDAWTASVVEIPGHHHHEPGEPCDHDHSQDAILENLPDEEILNMQKELKQQLDAIIAKTPLP